MERRLYAPRPWLVGLSRTGPAVVRLLVPQDSRGTGEDVLCGTFKVSGSTSPTPKTEVVVSTGKASRNNTDLVLSKQDLYRFPWTLDEKP